MPVEEREKAVIKAAAVPAQAGPRRESPIVRSRVFLGEVRSEMAKVTSPSRSEVRSTTTVVILAVFVFAAFFYVVDGALEMALQALVRWLGGA